MGFLCVPAEDADRHSWPDGGAYCARGRGGLEPRLPEDRETEAVRQAEDLRGPERRSFELTRCLFFFISEEAAAVIV